MKKDEVVLEVRAAYQSEWNSAIALAWNTFLKYDAPDYSPEGIRNFHDFIVDDELYHMFLQGSYPMFVALIDGKIRGMITMRGMGHISLLFVEQAFQGRGLGRALVEAMGRYLKEELHLEQMTVNASPYGVPFYHRVGFRDLESETEKGGIRYTPMEKLL